jgi:hypothetical protein
MVLSARRGKLVNKILDVAYSVLKMPWRDLEVRARQWLRDGDRLCADGQTLDVFYSPVHTVYSAHTDARTAC